MSERYFFSRTINNLQTCTMWTLPTGDVMLSIGRDTPHTVYTHGDIRITLLCVTVPTSPGFSCGL